MRRGEGGEGEGKMGQEKEDVDRGGEARSESYLHIPTPCPVDDC